MAIEFRPAEEPDLEGISAVFAAAYDDLRRSRGFVEAPTNPSPPPAILAFLLRQTPQAFWVAQDGGRIVGFADSFLRGTLWYLAWLFVSPSVQGRRVGHELLERTLAAWGNAPIENRATMTFAINPVSQSLYMRYGMYAREPVYRAEAAAASFRDEASPDDAMAGEEVESVAERRLVAAGLEEHALGFALGWHHDFFGETRAKFLVFGGRDDPLGYACVRPNGAVGPLVARSDECTRPILLATLRFAAKQGADKVSYWLPGSNTGAVDVALDRRMRLEPFVHMSTRPFARWENYLYHSAALM